MISANLCCVAAGALLGWTSPILPRLQNSVDDNPLGRRITPDENSWIGSLVSVGAVIGSFAAGYLAERYIAISTEQSVTMYYLLSRVLVDRPSTFQRAVELGQGFQLEASTTWLIELRTSFARIIARIDA